MLINAYKNKQRGMGFGDFIRGTISCYQLSKILKVRFKVDFRHHSIGKYIVNQCEFAPCEADQIIDLQDIRRFTASCLKDELLRRYKNVINLTKKNVFVYTNVWPRFPLSSVEKDFVKSILVPTDELNFSIQNAINIQGDYEVIHIRSGDLFAFNTKIGDTFERSLPELMQKLAVIEQIKRSTNLPIVVISDSFQLKHEICNRFDIITTNTIPSHCALEASGVKDTLVDYFVMTRAKYIHQFSVHSWGSGFSDTINWVYDIPIKTYKI
jgi:hypothetical protein